LNGLFFAIRIFFYFSVWYWISKTFFSKSVGQDLTGDPQITLDLQKKSTYSLILFALTITFSFVDLVMSLTPHWYSTIFGVYIFSGAVVVAFCVTSLIYMYLRKKNLLKSIVNLEHYHDLGKFIYGFNIFWSYIAFSQYFLIWYGNVPEETSFYLKHFKGSWEIITAILVIGHFAIPFILFMSRHAKRNLRFHFFMATWLVFMHFLDLYWIIMPNASPKGFHFNLLDITTFIGIGGIYFAVFFNCLSKVSLIPHKDPRLSESLNFHNF
ncbi:quinol:cytochrome C oxidoreductase, partial [Candidatus Marinamargulisbacteria bacterium SCGC AG-343-D04]